MKIPLTRGLFATVDDEDFNRLNQHKWYAMRSGKNFYAARFIKGPPGGPRQVLELMHRVVVEAPEDLEVDHKFGDTLDNRKTLLRSCTKQQNACNRPKKPGSVSRYLGVFPNGKNWTARIRVFGRLVNLGTFPTEEEAAVRRDAEARKLHGPFAVLNFV